MIVPDEERRVIGRKVNVVLEERGEGKEWLKKLEEKRGRREER